MSAETVLVVAAAGILTLNSLVHVPEGHFAVLRVFGLATTRCIDEGWHFVIPFSRLTVYSLSPRTMEVHCRARTAAGFEVTIPIQLSWRPSPTVRDADGRVKYHKNETSRVSSERLVDVVDTLIQSHTVSDLINRRSEIKEQINETLYSSEFGQGYGIDITEVNVGHIDLPREVEVAIAKGSGPKPPSPSEIATKVAQCAARLVKTYGYEKEEALRLAVLGRDEGSYVPREIVLRFEQRS